MMIAEYERRSAFSFLNFVSERVDAMLIQNHVLFFISMTSFSLSNLFFCLFVFGFFAIINLNTESVLEEKTQ